MSSSIELVIPSEGFASVNGLRIHYRDVGDRDAPAVVLLHGIMGHAREWDVLVAAVAARFRVVVVDLRGHGESEWAPEYTAAAMADDVAGLVDDLGLGSIRLIGHSMGGMAGLLLAAAQPAAVERLVVIDVGPDSLSTPMAAELPAMLRAMAAARYESPDEAFADWMAGDPLARPELLGHYVEHCLVPAGDGRLRYRFDGEGLSRFPEHGVDAAELWAAAERVVCPTLLVCGEHSPVMQPAAARQLADRMAACEVAVIPGGAHDLGVQQPEAVAAAALRFFGVP